MSPEQLEIEIRDAARELIGLYEALEERKYTAEKPPEVRTMQNTGGKPSMPGNWLWMNRGMENEQRLRRYAFAAFRDLQIKLKDDDGVIHNLLGKIAFNAQPISELSWAMDFHQELDDQARQMGEWLNPPEAQEVANSDPYLTMKSVQLSLTAKGKSCPEGTVRRWASEGKVATRKSMLTRTTYRLADIVRVLDLR